MGALRERLKNQGGGCGAGGEGEGEAGMFQRSNCFFEIISGRGEAKSQTAGPRQRGKTGVKDLFGLELLVYSYAPTGLPTPVWAKVVEREI